VFGCRRDATVSGNLPKAFLRFFMPFLGDFLARSPASGCGIRLFLTLSRIYTSGFEPDTRPLRRKLIPPTSNPAIQAGFGGFSHRRESWERTSARVPRQCPGSPNRAFFLDFGRAASYHDPEVKQFVLLRINIASK
jgi:hypothetical protein